MNLTTEQIERLRRVTGVGKSVRIRDKESGEQFLLGYVEDEVSVFVDSENKYVMQRIRCAAEQRHHGEYLYRISYYTFRTDGRLCLGGQFSPIMNEHEVRSLLEQVTVHSWF